MEFRALVVANTAAVVASVAENRQAGRRFATIARIVVEIDPIVSAGALLDFKIALQVLRPGVFPSGLGGDLPSRTTLVAATSEDWPVVPVVEVKIDTGRAGKGGADGRQKLEKKFSYAKFSS